MLRNHVFWWLHSSLWLIIITPVQKNPSLPVGMYGSFSMVTHDVRSWTCWIARSLFIIFHHVPIALLACRRHRSVSAHQRSLTVHCFAVKFDCRSPSALYTVRMFHEVTTWYGLLGTFKLKITIYFKFELRMLPVYFSIFCSTLHLRNAVLT